MIRTDRKELCSGCGACSIVCPCECIHYSDDVLGSLYATVDIDKCINCGACDNVCPMQRTFTDEQIGMDAYAAFSKDSNRRFRGSSGGLFETIAEYIISQHGFVFASGFDDGLKLHMSEAKTIEEVRKLTKSKYLQSDVAPCFPLIKNRLKQGELVLVCSTPCHIAALKNYLGKYANLDSLFLVDFFCHGVPSQQLFDKSKEYIENRYGITITGYEFRSKIKNGATPHYYTLSYNKNGRSYKKTKFYFADPFYLGFQKYITLRDSCYSCPYGNGNHVADITIGDFHDIDRYMRGINRFNGVSTVIINSDKGREVFEKVRESLVVYDMKIDNLYADRIIYSGGTAKPAISEYFLKDLENESFDYVVHKWLNSKHEWKKNVYYHLPSFIRKRLKYILAKE